MNTAVKSIAELRTSFYEDRKGYVLAGDSYGRWFIVGYRITRHYFDTSAKDSEIFSEQIKIKDRKNPKQISCRDLWRYR